MNEKLKINILAFVIAIPITMFLLVFTFMHLFWLNGQLSAWSQDYWGLYPEIFYWPITFASVVFVIGILITITSTRIVCKKS